MSTPLAIGAVGALAGLVALARRGSRNQDGEGAVSDLVREFFAETEWRSAPVYLRGTQLEVEQYSRWVGAPHVTRVESGIIPARDAFWLFSPAGFHDARSWHTRDGVRYFGSYPEPEWRDFVESVRRDGVRDRIWVEVRHGGYPEVMEGNHRVAAAFEAGIKVIPAVIRYYGHAERVGLVAPNVPRVAAAGDP